MTIEGTLNGTDFTALLEPDGQRSHWLRIDEKLLKASGVQFGDVAEFEVAGVLEEPDPDVPGDLLKALESSPEAQDTWNVTTNIARLDWIHWIDSSKQAATRQKRIRDACDMLGGGKKRVCCFDPSGYYSKAFCAPESVPTLAPASSKTRGR